MNLRELDRKKIELVSENTKLLQDLNIVEKLQKNVAESNQKNSEMAKENENLWSQLNVMKNRFETLVLELQKQIQSLNKNIDETFNNRKTDVDDIDIKVCLVFNYLGRELLKKFIYFGKIKVFCVLVFKTASK